MFLMLAVGAGCHHKTESAPNGTTTTDDDTTFAEDGADANATESDTQLVASSLIASSATGTIGLASEDLSGADLAPERLGDGVSAIYLPRGCLTVPPESNQTVTYQFSNCAFGPNGLTGITGDLAVHYTATATTLHLDITATGLTVNGAELDFTATADITASGTLRTMVSKSQLAGTTAGGRDFTRTSARTLSWTLGDACFALSGTSEGQIKKRDIRIEIADFKRCRRGCPEAGGKITVTNVAKDKQIELLYDGTNRATLVGPNGGESTVLLLCKG
jgi:hypothetical protein